MLRDYDRFASLFVPDGAWRMPHINEEFVGRDDIRAGLERLQGLWTYFVQNSHPGTIQLAGDSAVGRSYVVEFGHMRDGTSHLNYSVYHDRYQRTADGWGSLSAFTRSSTSTTARCRVQPLTTPTVPANPAAMTRIAIIVGSTRPGRRGGMVSSFDWRLQRCGSPMFVPRSSFRCLPTSRSRTRTSPGV